MDKLIASCFGKDYELKLRLDKYAYGDRVALMSDYHDEEYNLWMPFSNISVNLPDEDCGEDCIFIDTNNNPWAVDFIEKYNLGKATGNFGASGFCIYPEYKLDLNKVKEYI